MLDEVLTESVELMQEIGSSASVTLTLDMPNPITVIADRQRLKQVMLNLISNGIKYNTSGGSVKVATRLEGGRALIDVIDTGIGIAETQQKKLFSPFERLGAEGTGIEGTGLGLSLSKSLAEAMGGSLNCASAEGKGSTFTLRLAAVLSDLQGTHTHERHALNSNTENLSALILAIEDNPTNIDLLTRLFARRPTFVFVSANLGEFGLAMAAERVPDIILLDLHLPDVSGRDVLLKMKSDPNLKHVPVSIVSADAYAAQSESLLAAGAFRYVAKPFDLADLMAVIDEALIGR